MYLIEKLGGYEKAKRELKLKEDGSIFQCCISITSKMIRDALLEYRRANGIYEVGDWVVDTLVGNKVIKYHGGYENMPFGYVSLFLRHATDAEIEAGCKTMTDHAYKIGDKVVYKDTLHCKPVLMQIIEFGEVSKIPRCEIIGSVGAIGLKGPALVDLIRHATDAEIEMGKRVQQYETLPESVRQSLMEVS